MEFVRGTHISRVRVGARNVEPIQAAHHATASLCSTMQYVVIISSHDMMFILVATSQHLGVRP